MTELEFPWYKESLEAFDRRTQLSPKIAKCIEEHQEQICLSNCRSCISIGVGKEDADIPLLSKTCFSQLQTYTAVEPNGGNLGTFKRRLDQLDREDLKVSVVNKCVEDWEGPSEPVDVVLVIEVLYHIKDKPALFQRCLSWLAPGGRLLVAHAGEDAFFRIAQQFDVPDEQYTAKDVRSDFEKLNIKFEEARIEMDFDIKDRDRHIMNFLLQKDATEKELDALDKCLVDLESRNLCTLGVHVFWHRTALKSERSSH